MTIFLPKTRGPFPLWFLLLLFFFKVIYLFSSLVYGKKWRPRTASTPPPQNSLVSILFYFFPYSIPSSTQRITATDSLDPTKPTSNHSRAFIPHSQLVNFLHKPSNKEKLKTTKTQRNLPWTIMGNTRPYIASSYLYPNDHLLIYNDNINGILEEIQGNHVSI